jgi:hypothetical protein
MTGSGMVRAGRTGSVKGGENQSDWRTDDWIRDGESREDWISEGKSESE